MGNASTKAKFTTGSLPGGIGPELPEVANAPKVTLTRQSIPVTVPRGLKGGKTMEVTMPNGSHQQVTIPKRLRPGDVFEHTLPHDTSKVIASTLQSVPGMDTVQAKQVVYSSACVTVLGSYNGVEVEKVIQGLMEKAHTTVLLQAASAGCNAVLGMTCNITTSSSGDDGMWKLLAVTSWGTPCNLVPRDQQYLQ